MDWTALKTQIEMAWADGSWKARQFEIDGHMRQFHSLEEMRKFYEWVCKKVKEDAGTDPIKNAGYCVPLRNLGSGLV